MMTRGDLGSILRIWEKKNRFPACPASMFVSSPGWRIACCMNFMHMLKTTKFFLPIFEVRGAEIFLFSSGFSEKLVALFTFSDFGMFVFFARIYEAASDRPG